MNRSLRLTTTPVLRTLGFLFLFVLLLAGRPAMAQVPASCPAGSATCSNQYCPASNPATNTNLGCTANDVQITKIGINRTGSNFTGTSCTGGSTITVDLNVTVSFGSSTRYNIGIFLAQDGKDPSKTIASGGSSACTAGILPLGTIRNPFTTGTVASPFSNLDANSCGDGSKSLVPSAAYSSATGTSSAGAGTATFVMPNVILPCTTESAAASGKLTIPFIVTWDQQAGTAGSCAGPADISPGTKSKCSTPDPGIGDVDVQVLPLVTKTLNLSSISPGDTATYTISVANTTGVALSNFTFADSSSITLTDTLVVNPTSPYFYISSATCSATSGTCPTVTPTNFAKSSTTNLTVPSLPVGATMTFSVTGQLLGAPVSSITNTGSATVSTTTSPVITSTAIGSVTTPVVYPALSTRKTVSVLSDPVRGTTSPVYIPGSIARYTIDVSNAGQGRVDTNTAIVTDPIPPNTKLYVQLPPTGTAADCATAVPVAFTDGAPSSNLTFAASGSDITYASNAGPNYTYTATPSWVFVSAATNGTANPGCYASNVTSIRVNPKGRMAESSSFKLDFRVYLF